VFFVGLGAALAASVLFNVGVVLQALDARAAPRSLGYRVALLGRLVRRPRWVLGLLLGLAGVWPQVVAYAHAPFVVVQPALAVGLLLLLVLGIRMLGERVGLREVAGVVAILGGVALVAWGAPHHSDAHRNGAAVVAVAAGLSAVALVPFLLRGTRWDTGLLAIVATGCGFAATNVATKLVGDDFDLGHAVNVVSWGAVAVAMGVVATITNMTAFQRRAATIVVPVSSSLQTFLPIVLEPLFLREHWGSVSHDGLPLTFGLALALVGNVLVAGTRAVSDLISDAA